MTELEQLIEHAAGTLPKGWSIIVRVENGYGGVTVERPNGESTDMDDGESDIREQFRDALQLIRDEIEAERLSKEEKGGAE